MQTSRKKIILEHLVVRKLGAGGGGAGGGGGRESGSADVRLKQSELDDILRCALLGRAGKEKVMAGKVKRGGQQG